MEKYGRRILDKLVMMRRFQHADSKKNLDRAAKTRNDAFTNITGNYKNVDIVKHLLSIFSSSPENLYFWLALSEIDFV